MRGDDADHGDIQNERDEGEAAIQGSFTAELPSRN